MKPFFRKRVQKVQEMSREESDHACEKDLIRGKERRENLYVASFHPSSIFELETVQL